MSYFLNLRNKRESDHQLLKEEQSLKIQYRGGPCDMAVVQQWKNFLATQMEKVLNSLLKNGNKHWHAWCG